ncbi:hypothetical protein F5877DRAFT_24178, partial [Lentinula edodes]
VLGGSLPDKEKSRRIITKIVNLLATKLELGGPMICLYLLGNPDYYSSHVFVPLYWKCFVTAARKDWHIDNDI